MTSVFRLPNGVTCVVEQRPGPVSFQVGIKAGSYYEEADENGLTFLTAQATFGGTKTRSREEIAEAMESRGASAGIQRGCGSSSIVFTAQALSSDIQDMFAILADVIRNPAFDPVEINLTKMNIAQNIDYQAQQPSTKAAEGFSSVAFSGQSAARPVHGDKSLLESFTPAQVAKKHAELLSHPENIVISFAGDIDVITASMLAENHFSDLQATATPQIDPRFTFTGGDTRESVSNNQLNILFGFPAVGHDDPDRYAFTLLNELLSGGMSSPLFQEIREKRGLVYGVRAGYLPLQGTGTFYISAGTGKGNAGELLSASFDLLGDVAKNGFSQQEIKQAIDRIKQGRDSALESTEFACSSNLSAILKFGRTIPPEETQEKLNQVTNDDIRRVCAQMLLGGKYALSNIGPQDTMPSENEIMTMMSKQIAGVTIPPASVKPAISLTSRFTQSVAKNISGRAEPQITTLANGLKVVTLEREGTLSCGAWVGAGSSHETLKLNGATHMNEHMMFKGTPSYGPGVIDQIIEGELGGGLNAYTNKDKTAYYFFNLRAESLEQVMNICGEMVFEANIDEVEFSGRKNPDGSKASNGERDVVIEEIKMYSDKPSSREGDLLFSAAYPNQPHGRTILGPAAGLEALTAADLRAYRDEYYAPNNVVLSIVGPVEHGDVVAIAEKKFGQMKPSNFPPLPEPSYVGDTVFLEMDQAKLCEFTLGAEGVSITDPEALVYDAMSYILGGGKSSRLQKEIVNRQNLTSKISAGNAGYRNAGLFYIGGSAEPDRMKSLVSSVYGEIHRLAQDVSEEELAKVKAVLEMHTLKGTEANDDACRVYGEEVLAFGKAQTLNEMLNDIRKLTVDDIKRVAQKIMASNPTLSMVVPKGTDPSLLPTHEEVVAMRDRQWKAPGSAPKPGFGPSGPA